MEIGLRGVNMFDLIKILHLAHKTAMKSDCKYKVSCILTDNRGKIISTGYNHYSFNGNKLGKYTVHAEMDAILQKIHKPSKNLIAFIYRKNSRIITPCDACSKLLSTYGIKTIWFTNGTGWEREC